MPRKGDFEHDCFLRILIYDLKACPLEELIMFTNITLAPLI